MTADRKDLVREIQRRILSIKKAVHDMTEARKVANHLAVRLKRHSAMKKKSVPTLKKFGNTLTVWNSKSMTKSGHCLNIANYYSRNKVKGRAISLFPLFF